MEKIYHKISYLESLEKMFTIQFQTWSLGEKVN